MRPHQVVISSIVATVRSCTLNTFGNHNVTFTDVFVGKRHPQSELGGLTNKQSHELPLLKLAV